MLWFLLLDHTAHSDVRAGKKKYKQKNLLRAHFQNECATIPRIHTSSLSVSIILSHQTVEEEVCVLKMHIPEFLAPVKLKEEIQARIIAAARTGAALHYTG